MNNPETWHAKWEGSVLHIDGTTDLFPNDFSTSHLRRRTTENECDGDVVAYDIGFARDKEPFCTKNLIGSVHHWERAVPEAAKRIRIYADVDDFVEIAIPNK
jgi:hypothetical protein